MLLMGSKNRNEKYMFFPHKSIFIKDAKKVKMAQTDLIILIIRLEIDSMMRTSPSMSQRKI